MPHALALNGNLPDFNESGMRFALLSEQDSGQPWRRWILRYGITHADSADASQRGRHCAAALGIARKFGRPPAELLLADADPGHPGRRAGGSSSRLTEKGSGVVSDAVVTTASLALWRALSGLCLQAAS